MFLFMCVFDFVLFLFMCVFDFVLSTYAFTFTFTFTTYAYTYTYTYTPSQVVELWVQGRDRGQAGSLEPAPLMFYVCVLAAILVVGIVLVVKAKVKGKAKAKGSTTAQPPMRSSEWCVVCSAVVVAVYGVLCVVFVFCW